VVGTRVGLNVGLLLMETGLSDGAVGILEGMTDGLPAGYGLVETVGAAEGAGEGFSVGVRLGDQDG